MMNSNWFTSFDASSNTELFLVDMAIERESDQMLVSVSNGSISFRPLAKAILVSRWNMSYNNSEFTSFFNTLEGLFKPDELRSRVIKSSPQVIVEMVANLSVNGYNVDFLVNSAIAGLQLSCVETVLLVNLFSFSIKPFVPDFHVELQNWVRLFEVLRVRDDKIVVAFQDMD